MYFIYTENTVTAPFLLGKAARRSRPARAVVAQRRGGGLAEAGRESRSTFDPAAARCAPAGAPPLGAGTAGSCVIGARRREGKDRRKGPGRGQRGNETGGGGADEGAAEPRPGLWVRAGRGARGGRVGYGESREGSERKPSGLCRSAAGAVGGGEEKRGCWAAVCGCGNQPDRGGG